MRDQEPIPVPLTPPGQTPVGEAAPLPVPDHTLIRRIGRGSYGEVWLARNVMGAWRAVKFVHRRDFDHDRPFERELAGIERFEPISRSHPSQLNILHVGRGPDGFYYVMELADDQGRGQEIVEGSYAPRTLRSELLQHGRLPYAQCLEIGVQLATALQHLHDHGLVHRDIKPSNIVFVNGIPKLADIGLVARAEATLSFVGTEGYLPPEGPGTRQADIFSLGKVLYELSTGQDRQQFPEMPTQIASLEDRHQIAELNQVVLKACHPDPKQRYQSAAELQSDLALLQSGQSVARVRLIEQRLRFVQRAGALVTALAAVIALGWWWQAKQTREMRDLAEDNRRIAEERSALVSEKTILAEEKSALAEENRERLVRLSIANGVRLLDEADPSGALLWFAQALPLVTNRPAEEEIHRIRIQHTLDPMPRLVRLLSHREGENIRSGTFSPDGRTIATASGRQIRLWSVDPGTERDQSIRLPERVHSVRFTPDGRRLIALGEPDPRHTLFGWSSLVGLFDETVAPGDTAILDAFTGETLHPPITNATITLLSPDASWLAAASADGHVSVMATADGQVVTDRIRHGDRVLTLAFSEDSQLLVTGGADRVARLWRLPSGEPVGSGLVHEAPVVRAVFRPGGRHLATTECELDNPGKRSCLVRVWDVHAGREAGAAKQTADWVWALFFEPGSRGRLFVGLGTTVQVWDPESLAELLPALEMNSTARCWTFARDGSAVVVGSDDGTARIWELEGGARLLPPFPHTGWVEWVEFSPDGERLLTTGDDGLAKVWSLDFKAESARLDLPANHAQHSAPSLATVPGIVGRRTELIPVHLDDGSVVVLNSGTMALERVVAPPSADERICASEESPSGRWLALVDHHRADPETSKTPHTVNLWQAKPDGGLELRTRLPHPDHIFHMAFCEDRSELLALDASLIRIWRVSDGTLIRSLPLPAPFQPIWSDIMPESITPDGRRILLWRGNPFQDWTIQLFDVLDAELIGPRINVTQLANFPNLMRYSPDGSWLAMVGAEQMGTFIDLATGELAAPRFKHGGNLFDLDWNPDGTRLITTGLAPNVKMWDAATGELLLAPMDLPTSAPARSARWSADGRFVVGRNDGKVARVWDAATAEPVTPIFAHEGAVHWACLTPGNRLITASGPNLLRTWELKPTALPADAIADYARFVSGRRLSASGVILGIPALELSELEHSLRGRHPELFSPGTARD